MTFTTAHFKLSAAALAVTAALAASVDAQIVRTTAFGDGADTFGNELAANTVQGANATIQAKRDSSNRRMAYIRFDISNLGPGLDSTDIISANLALTTASAAANVNRSYDIWGLNDVSASVGGDADRTVTGDVSTGGWLETGSGALTWNNAPGRVGSVIRTDASLGGIGTPSAVGTLIGTFTPQVTLATDETFTFGSLNSANVTTSTDFTENLLAFLNADTNGLVTFAFTYSVNAAPVASFHAKEGDNPLFAPTLSVVIPEPASAAAVAGVGLLALRRRRH